MNVEFYTRPGCHLCEQAKETVNRMARKLQITVLEKNIDEREDWTEKYGLIIPVLKADGELIAYGQIEYTAAFEKINRKLTDN